MEILDYFSREWHVIGQAPATFLIALALVSMAAYTAASWRFGGVMDALREQTVLLQKRLDAVPGGADSERRRQVRDALGEFLQRGTALMSECKDYEKPPPEEAAEEWFTKLIGYLESELGTAYVARVNDGGSAPVGYMSQHVEHDKLYNGIRVRVFHLQEFLKELSR